MNLRVSPLALVAIAGVLACEGSWNRLNQAALARDIQEVLTTHGIKVDPPTCAMVGTTRTGRCRVRLSGDAVERLIRVVPLEDVEPSAAIHLDATAGDPVEGCRTVGDLPDAARLRIYRSARRPPTLQVKTGGAFEYLILVHDPQTDAACIQVSYAYG